MPALVTALPIPDTLPSQYHVIKSGKRVISDNAQVPSPVLIASKMSKKLLLSIDPPDSSDGNGVQPQLDATTILCNEEEIHGFMRKVKEPLKKWYLEHADCVPGNWTSEQIKAGFRFHDSAELKALPAGYTLIGKKRGTGTRPQDKYCYGHPNGGKFRSAVEIVPHIMWLASSKDPRKRPACECKLCDSAGAGSRNGLVKEKKRKSNVDSDDAIPIFAPKDVKKRKVADKPAGPVVSKPLSAERQEPFVPPGFFKQNADQKAFAYGSVDGIKSDEKQKRSLDAEKLKKSAGAEKQKKPGDSSNKAKKLVDEKPKSMFATSLKRPAFEGLSSASGHTTVESTRGTKLAASANVKSGAEKSSAANNGRPTIVGVGDNGDKSAKDTASSSALGRSMKLAKPSAQESAASGTSVQPAKANPSTSSLAPPVPTEIIGLKAHVHELFKVMSVEQLGNVTAKEVVRMLEDRLNISLDHCKTQARDIIGEAFDERTADNEGFNVAQTVAAETSAAQIEERANVGAKFAGFPTFNVAGTPQAAEPGNYEPMDTNDGVSSGQVGDSGGGGEDEVMREASAPGDRDSALPNDEENGTPPNDDGRAPERSAAAEPTRKGLKSKTNSRFRMHEIVWVEVLLNLKHAVGSIPIKKPLEDGGGIENMDIQIMHDDFVYWPAVVTAVIHPPSSETLWSSPIVIDTTKDEINVGTCAFFSEESQSKRTAYKVRFLQMKEVEVPLPEIFLTPYALICPPAHMQLKSVDQLEPYRKAPSRTRDNVVEWFLKALIQAVDHASRTANFHLTDSGGFEFQYGAEVFLPFDQVILTGKALTAKGQQVPAPTKKASGIGAAGYNALGAGDKVIYIVENMARKDDSVELFVRFDRTDKVDKDGNAIQVVSKEKGKVKGKPFWVDVVDVLGRYYQTYPGNNYPGDYVGCAAPLRRIPVGSVLNLPLDL
ncbi:hypothetical protein HK101_009455 [Irineochytrium annulatum]|nr:hypothetical protein HK101_009455 [Irineochytrium annulatum]